MQPRDTTKSHHATELTWEVYWEEVQRQLLSKSGRKERGKKGLPFIRGYSAHT